MDNKYDASFRVPSGRFMGRKTNSYSDIRPVGTVYAGAVYIEIMCKQYIEYF